MTAKTFLKRFIKDQNGVGWVLGVAVISLVFTPFLYFPLSYAWDQFYGVVAASYTFTGVTAQAIIVVRLIIYYLAAFSVFIIIGWAIVQAKSKRYEA
jgi:hypothetical protein